MSPKRSLPTPSLYVLTFFAATGGLLSGYDCGVVAGAMILLRDTFSLSTAWQQLLVGATVGTAALFSLVGGACNERLGRKPVSIIACVTFTAGAVVMATASDRYVLVAGRAVVGAAVGLASMTSPIYIAECAVPSLRGTLVSINQLCITLGILLAGLVNGGFSHDREHGWRYILGISGIPSIIQLIGFLFVPESPRWLINRGRIVDARNALRKLRGADVDVEPEVAAIQEACDESRREQEQLGHGSKLGRMLKTPTVKRALILGCTLQIAQQLSGINTIIYYSATTIKMAGVRDDSNAIWLSSITAVINFLVTFVGMWLVEKIGRRPLTLISLSAVSVSSLLIGLGFVVISQSSPGVSTRGETWTACSKYGSCEPCVTDPACGFCFRGKGGEVRNGTCMMAAREDYYTEALSGSCSAKNTRKGMVWAYDYCPTPYFWTVLAGLVLFLFSFAPGLGPMPSTINSEIYPTWARSTGNGVATAVNWTCNLLVSMTFISLTEAITKQGAYFLFAVVGFVFLSVLFLILPETKGKSLEEIEEVFANNVLWWKIRAYVPLKST